MVKRLLITGGAGFIGVNATRHFLKKGWQVTVFDNFSRKGTDVNIKALLKEYPGVTVVRGDVVKDQRKLAIEVGKVEAVLHLAAQVAVTTSVTEPRNDFEQNAVGTFNVLETIRLSKNRPALIYSSTNKVYGSLPEFAVAEKKTRYVFKNKAVQTHGVSEQIPLDFHSPYGCSKGAADQYVIDYARIYGLKTVVFRQSCIYGEHQFGIEDQGWIAWFTIAAMRRRKITIFGNGKQVRDALYVGDLVELYEKAFTKMSRISGRAYNVGGGPHNTLSLIECLSQLEKALGTPIPTVRGAIRSGDQPIFVADVRRAKKDIGWTPKTSFEEGFARMYVWMRENKETIASVV